MVEHYRQLIPDADSVLLPGIGHYPQLEAPVLVLRHYLAFRGTLDSTQGEPHGAALSGTIQWGSG
jgi:hypothetical protein